MSSEKIALVEYLLVMATQIGVAFWYLVSKDAKKLLVGWDIVLVVGLLTLVLGMEVLSIVDLFVGKVELGE